MSLIETFLKLFLHRKIDRFDFISKESGGREKSTTETKTNGISVVKNKFWFNKAHYLSTQVRIAFELSYIRLAD